MLRAVVLSIVLTLAIGPNAALLCSVRCHPNEVDTSACQHRDPTSRQVTGVDGCRVAPVSAAIFVRDGKAGSPRGGTQQPILIAAYRFTPMASDASRTCDTHTSFAVGGPPPRIALRL